MSAFTITDQPNKYYLGEQPQVTLVNDGPFSIYLDENSAVSELNGFELPPTGQMTWKASKEIWAKTRSIVGQETSARLITSPAGELSLTTRAKFVKQLHSALYSTTGGGTTPYIEVGHCNTLYLKRQAGDASGAGNWAESVILSWYDSDLNLLSIDPMFIATGPSAVYYSESKNTWRARIPVKGKYLKITLEGSYYIILAPTNTSSPFSVHGTDITEPLSLPNVPYSSFPFGYNFSRGEFELLNYVSANGTITIPAYTNKIKLVLLNNTAVAGNLGLFDAIGSATPLDWVQVPANTGITATFNASSNNGFILGAWLAGFAGLGLNIRFSYI